MEMLAGLNAGERAAVLRVPPDVSKSLARLGLRPGTEITCLRRLPLGDPTVYRWRGIDAALRRKDAARIEVLRRKEESAGCRTLSPLSDVPTWGNPRSSTP